MPNIRLSDAIEQFAEWAVTNYAPGTLKGQRASLDMVLSEVGNIWTKNLTAAHVDRFAAARRSAGVHPHTLRNNLVHLRQFCEFARARKFTPVNWDPVGRRRTPRVVPRDPVIIPVHEFPRLLDAAANPRDRAIIAFGLFTLCRQSEAKLVTVGDLDLDEGWVAMSIQKSGIRDRMPVSAELHVEMHRWLAAYEAAADQRLPGHWKLLPALAQFGVGRDARGRLLPAPLGHFRPIPTKSPTKVHWAVQRALENAGYPTKQEGLHTLRRSAARARFDQLVHQGYDGALREVQALLHHSSLVTTELYLGLTQTVRKRDEAIRGRRMFDDPRPTLRLVGE